MAWDASRTLSFYSGVRRVACPHVYGIPWRHAISTASVLTSTSDAMQVVRVLQGAR